ncbi:myoneurin-like [Plakobranchus ocellatus]|uniref:Myoneurin-like n=1 Tax=Plakobranchus ocellatus TaxID=259542 RepID=A0AAV4CPC4_9GAST|nr:myoneurin-like [Plakobranchus ocellatus]
MYTCVLIPRELSLVLALQPSPSPSPSSRASPGHAPSPILPAHQLVTCASVWSNSHLRPGTVFYPDEGEVRLDRLDMRVSPQEDDVSTGTAASRPVAQGVDNAQDMDKQSSMACKMRRSYGSYDVMLDVQGQQVRHCNWVRFVRSTLDPGSANVISSKVRGQAFFQVTRAVKPSEEIVVLFHVEPLPGNSVDAAFPSATEKPAENFPKFDAFSENADTSEIDKYDYDSHRVLSVLKASSSSSTSCFSGGFKNQEPISSMASPKTSTHSSTSALSSSLVSSTMVLNPTQYRGSSSASMLSSALAFGGLGMPMSMYDHLTLMSVVQQQQQQQRQQQQQQRRRCDVNEESESLMNLHNQKVKGQSHALRPTSPPPPYYKIASFNAGSTMMTSTPVSMVTTVKREKNDEEADENVDEKVGNDVADKEETSHDEKTPNMSVEQSSMKTNVHQPRSLYFESSLSLSSSSDILSLSAMGPDSPRPLGLRNDNSGNDNTNDRINESLRDYSASSPMFTSGSSHSREISSASEICAGEESGVNLSISKDSSEPCPSVHHQLQENADLASREGKQLDNEDCKGDPDASDKVAEIHSVIEKEKYNEDKSKEISSNVERLQENARTSTASETDMYELNKYKTEEKSAGGYLGYGGRENKERECEAMAPQVDSTVDFVSDKAENALQYNDEGNSSLVF